MICLTYLVAAYATQSDYGITWDEAVSDWYTGERDLRYYLTFDKKWLDYTQPIDFSMGGRHPELIHWGMPWRIMHFGHLLSSAGCYVFFVKLDLLDPAAAHHVPNHLLMAGALAAMFYFIRKRFGIAAAAVASFAMIFQPHWWAHGHFNTKDYPYACLMAFTLLSARRGILNRSAGWIAAASILLGLSGATKLNATLIPLIIALWYPFARYDRGSSTAEGGDNLQPKIYSKMFWAAIILSPIIAFIIYFLSWPYLWADPINNLMKHLDWAMRRASVSESGVQWKNLAIFVVTLPPAVLLFGLIGSISLIVGIKRNKNREAGALLLLWAYLPVLRMALPKMHNFDGVRHFIEYAIPLGAITGIGAVETFRFIASRLDRLKPVLRKTAVAAVGIAVAIPFLTWGATLIKLHPNELVYFNFLIGGAKGASEKYKTLGFAGDYWGSSYRQGVDWLNDNVEPEAIVVAPLAGHIVQATQQMWMRADIILLAAIMYGDDAILEAIKQIPPRPVYVIYITRADFYGPIIRRAEAEGSLVHAIYVDGVPILKIIKLSDLDIAP